MGFIRSIFGFLVMLIVLIFAAGNRHDVEVFYTPFTPPVHLPLYAIVLSLMALGFIMGGVLVWLNESPLRQDRRKSKKEIKILQKKINTLKKDSNAPPASELFPALPNFKKN